MSFQPGTGKVGNPGFEGRKKIVRHRYSFAKHGGAVGAITLDGPAIPSGAIVTDCVIRVVDAATSGGAATVSVGVESATDVRAAATLATAPALSTTGAKRSAVLTATTAPLVTTVARDVVATVAVAALTAGTFDVITEYFEVA